jgi:ribulose kinase
MPPVFEVKKEISVTAFLEVTMSLRKMFGKTMLCAMLGASLLAGVATPARADRDDKCRNDIRRAEQNLEKAVRKHGEHSEQAEQRRRQLEEVRERCKPPEREHEHAHDHDQDRR